MAWQNGNIPASDLIVFKRGHNSTDGDWYWALTPATLARHNALVRRGQARTGRTLAPSDGFSTYRPRHSQELARRLYGNGAAVPGTSSHGGFWEGRETLAIDYGNWSWVYSGNRAAFYEDARAVGLTPDMISPRRGYPDEPWHLIDLNPRSAVPAFADAKPFQTEELDMDNGTLKQLVKDALVELKGNDGRNLLDGIIQTRNELRDRAAEGAQRALYAAKGNDGRNLFDGVIQARYDIADVAVRVSAGGIDPKALAQAIDDAGLAKDVADELARRMAG